MSILFQKRQIYLIMQSQFVTNSLDHMTLNKARLYITAQDGLNREGLRLVSKESFEEMEPKFPLLWNIPSGKTGLPLRMFRCSRKFSAETTQKNRVSFTFQPDFQETVNGKQPLFAFG